MYQPNVIYHVFNHSNNREIVFRTDADYRLFLQKMRTHLLPVCDILCYCLMPTHFHIQLVPKSAGLIEQPSNGQQKIHAAFRIMLSSFTRVINQGGHRRGSLFRAKTIYKPAYDSFVPEDWELEQEQPFTRLIPYISQCFDYIHRNPAAAGLVSEAIHWPYSSLLDYEGLRGDDLCNYDLAKRLIGISRPADSDVSVEAGAGEDIYSVEQESSPRSPNNPWPTSEFNPPPRPTSQRTDLTHLPRPTSQRTDRASADEGGDFLLQTPVARRLYHDYASGLPIIDYHNHLSPADIANNRQFSDITAAWLEGDHYKWRAMRANGVKEEYITGQVTGRDKFKQWAATVPYTLRNPLYHWTHLELHRYFGITERLNEDSADRIYAETTAQLKQESHRVHGLLERMKVEVVCTTDHPTDDLEHHRTHRKSVGGVLMLPTFRPDKFLMIGASDYLPFLEKLEAIAGKDIKTFTDLLEALEARIDHFSTLGCQLADHGLSQLFAVEFRETDLNRTMEKKRTGDPISITEQRQFQMALLRELGKLYHQRGWTMQLHLGPLRNTNSRLMRRVGADVGCDSIGDFEQARGLAAFLDGLDQRDQLPKTILYNLNPRDNEVFATMAGNFNDGSMPGKIQWGSAWWFLDQKDGMEKQLNTLSNMGLLSRFVGMLTDSRSFLSFPRHEYFRRILCNLIGNDVAAGLLPDDEKWLGEMIRDISYRNAKKYFEFDQ